MKTDEKELIFVAPVPTLTELAERFGVSVGTVEYALSRGKGQRGSATSEIRQYVATRWPELLDGGFRRRTHPTMADLAREFGVTRELVRQICTGRIQGKSGSSAVIRDYILARWPEMLKEAKPAKRRASRRYLEARRARILEKLRRLHAEADALETRKRRAG